eukprot:GHVN01030986.1.p1 GENE.GHVN01030986.1~~GHVN01030986.1.p1  ORF type:complete len:220 (+),score=30.59 GHVN01030986.1:294-953(+)
MSASEMEAKKEEEVNKPAEFDFGEKRKKTKKKAVSSDPAPSTTPTIDGCGNEFVKGPLYPYDELLTRVQKMIHDHNPRLGGRGRLFVKPPQVVRLGKNRSVWMNFSDLSKSLLRETDHVCQFVLAELAVDGSIAGGGQLVLKGRFTQKDIEKLLRKYIREYVTCKMCRAATTKLERDTRTRLHSIVCSSCGANRSVVTIKSGFHAISRADRRQHRMANT